MKDKLLIFVFLIFTTSCMSTATTNEHSVVANSVGRVILVHDRVWGYQDDSYQTGGYVISKKLESEYAEHIKSLPVKNRVEYFWSISMHVSLDGSFLEDFLLLLKKDCGKEYISRIDSFLNESKKLKINGPDQMKVRRIKSVLTSMM